MILVNGLREKSACEITDKNQSEVIAFVFFFLHIVRIAGFFAQLIIRQRGTIRFAKDRTMGIGGTLALTGRA